MRGRAIGNWALLAVGFVLMVFSRGNFSVAPAAWLFPIFFLTVARRAPAVYAIAVIPLLTGVASQISFWGFTEDVPRSLLFFIPLIAGTVYGGIFAVDRWLVRGWENPAALLGFPLLATSFEFLLNLFNPFGTTGLLGYSQLEFRTFSQLASLTGMWGLAFVMAWLGSIVAGELTPVAARRPTKQAFVFASILLLILVYGWIRIQTAPAAPTVKIASVYVHDRDVEGLKLWKLLDDKNERGIRIVSRDIHSRLFSETRKLAADGAQIIAWAELSLFVLNSDEPVVQAEIAALARELNVYLVASPYVAAIDDATHENKVWLFSPSGKLVLEHLKFGGNFLEGTVPGSGLLQTVDTEFGRLSAIVCWDADFPSTIRQAGAAGTDILFVPSSDWRAITPAHAALAAFRGIENGCAIVRPTQNGLSIISDGAGRILADCNHFEDQPWIITAQVPTHRAWALYPIIGDAFGWLALAGTILILGLRLRSRNRNLLD